MIKLTAFFTCILAFAATASNSQASENPTEDQEFCEAFNEYQEELSQKLPLRADSITDVTSMQIDCVTKQQTWTKRLAVTENELSTGWRDRKVQQHRQLHCNNDGLTSAYGWTVVDKIFDKNSNMLIEIITAPNDCKSL